MSLVVGAHIMCFINGSLFGEVTGIDIDVSTPSVTKRGLDRLEAVELAHGAVSVNGSFRVLRVAGTGGLQGQGLVSPLHLLSQEKYSSVILVSRKTGQRLFQTDYLKVTHQRWSFNARQRVVGSFSFEAIGVLTEFDG